MPLTTNIDKAKNIWKDKIRVARKPKLEELDVEFVRAQETGADTSAIVAKKKELRDFPAQVDSATTTDEIKSQMDIYIAENDKFTDKGVKASATRARKALQELGKLIKARRKEILEEKAAASSK